MLNVKQSINKTFNKPLTKLQLLIISFFIYSVIGWLLESLYSIYELGHFVNRGFLFGPLCPIYGYGAIIILLILKPFNKNNFTLFISSAIILSVFEYLVGFGLDAMFSMRFWDYTNEFLNINGRITLWFSLIWGIGGIIFINFIHPTITKFLKFLTKNLKPTLQHILLYLIIIGYIADTLAASVYHFL